MIAPQSFTIAVPEGASRLLLHCCCAPCSGAIIEGLLEVGANPTLYFYNPNIHPREEYEKRKAEIVRFASKLGVPFVDGDYDADAWFARVKGLEQEPERGTRCDLCFSIRLERAALYASENGFPLFATSLGISRWKNLDHVNEAGHKAAERYEGLKYWDYNWRKQGGSARQVEVTKREGFYQQDYCGCAFSLRDRKARQAAK